MILTFDLETTGFDPEEDEIIEVGMVVHDRAFHMQERKGWLVTPSQPVPEEVVELTGITNEKLKEEGDRWEIVKENFRRYLEKSDIWCAHNSDFDFRFVQSHYTSPPSHEYTVDTMRISERFLPTDVLSSNSLEALADFFGVSLQNAHRAVEDASATADVLQEMLSDLNLEIPDLLTDQPVKLGKYHIGEDPIDALYSGLSDR